MSCKKSSMYDCWLRYDINNGRQDYSEFAPYFMHINTSLSGEIITCAVNELSHAGEAMTGIIPSVSAVKSTESHIALELSEGIPADGFEISVCGNEINVSASTETGILYGAFRLIFMIVGGKSLNTLAAKDAPFYPLRMINHWDNGSGDIERGYSGKSIFFSDYKLTENLGRIKDYARLLASVGINAVSINNVNVHKLESRFITDEYLDGIERFAQIFRSYGVKLYLSVNYAAPIEIGGLDTADPLDIAVADWWKRTAENVYKHIPDLGGFLVKADSENRPGPFTYNRTHAQGANMLADSVARFGGRIIWRCFVYNCHLDWRDRSTDRAKAAYDNFKPLDGKFRENVILQIKNGPMDFQIREATSPLFGAMPATNQMAEFQIAQEYTGQQKHLCYLVPMWKECLDFDTFCNGNGSYVKNIIMGTAAVSNIGDDRCWTGSPLAAANFYGYGRLAFNPQLSAEEIAREWIDISLGNDERIRNSVLPMLLKSRRVYENYTSPLGIGWMVTPHTHYGPSVDGYEYDAWGTYHYADFRGMGVDRTMATGTGYTGQYFKKNMEIYENIKTCPEELLLFFHFVPYDYVLKNGKTLIQHIYDTHFSGADDAAEFCEIWNSLEALIDAETFALVKERFKLQKASSIEWRDIINTYFYRRTGVDDAGGRKIYK